jgi:hypothetical protein
VRQHASPVGWFGGERSGTDQQLHDIGMALAGGDPQRRRPVPPHTANRSEA